MIFQITSESRQVTVQSPSSGAAMDWFLSRYPGETITGVSAIATVETDETDGEE